MSYLVQIIDASIMYFLVDTSDLNTLLVVIVTSFDFTGKSALCA